MMGPAKKPDRLRVATEYYLDSSEVDTESDICHISTAVYEGSEDVLIEVDGVLGIYIPRWQLERVLAMMPRAEGAAGER